MIRRLRPTVLALAGTACLSAPAAAQPDVRGMLFTMGVNEDGSAYLEPVAALLETGYGDPPGEVDSLDADPVAARWLRPGTRYDLLSRGERAGSVTLQGAEMAGCAGIALRGALDVPGRLADDWRGLAGNGLPDQAHAPWLRAVTADERRRLDGMAAALFDAHGVRVADRTWGDTVTAALTDGGDARPVLVASYALRKENDPWLRQTALFIVAEDDGGGYRPAHAWFVEAVEAEIESRELLDAVDLDGDGKAELIVRNNYYESWSFSILTRTRWGWDEVYRGGGGGC